MTFYRTSYANYDMPFWIGLWNLNGSGSDLKMYEWMDGSAVTFSNWNQNEPNGSYGEETCVSFAVGTGKKWETTNCSDTKSLMCMFRIPPCT